MVAVHTPELIVSLLDPDFAFPELGSEYAERHLCLRMHDAHESSELQVVPTMAHVDRLLGFLGLWQRSAPVLEHCRAGIGRSTAVGFMAACLYNPTVGEVDIALTLRRVSPLARPNEILVKLADTAMTRNGRMLTAIKKTGRDLSWHNIDENVPFEILC